MSRLLCWFAFEPSHFTIRCFQDRQSSFTGRSGTQQQLLLGPKIQPGSVLSTIRVSVGLQRHWMILKTPTTTDLFVSLTPTTLKMDSIQVHSPWTQTFSNQQTFWFGQIQHAPSTSASLNQTFLRIDSSDSAIQYSPADGWTQGNNELKLAGPEFGRNNSYTQIAGATIRYQFFGS